MNRLEDQRTEFKTSWEESHLRQLCAMANSQGGSMYIGVNDNGDIVGVKNPKKLLEEIPNTIVHRLNYRDFEVNLHTDAEGHDYIEVRIAKSNEMISFRNVFYRRIGSTTQAVSKLPVHFEPPVRKTGWDSATWSGQMPAAMVQALTSFMSGLGLVDAGDDGSQAMLWLYRQGLSPSPVSIARGSAICFHPSPGQISRGAEGVLNIIGGDGSARRKVFSGPLLEQIPAFEAAIMEALGPGDVSMTVIHQALVNAYVHQDYEARSPVTATIDEDTVEISNRMALSYDWSDDGHAAFSPNPVLGEMLRLAGLMNGCGLGLTRIRKSCADRGFGEPRWILVPAFSARFVVQRRHEEALPDEDGWITALQDEDFDKGPFEGPSLSLMNFKESLWRTRLRDYEKEWKLTGDQMAVLSEVLKDPSISISAMSRATGLSKHLVGRQLASMETLGLLAREGRTWHVAPRTREEGND